MTENTYLKPYTEVIGPILEYIESQNKFKEYLQKLDLPQIIHYYSLIKIKIYTLNRKEVEENETCIQEFIEIKKLESALLILLEYTQARFTDKQ